MKSRIPLIVAVVGALLVGGATTGTTRASWTDHENMAGSTLAAATMDFTVTGAPPTIDLTAPGTTTVTLAVADISSAVEEAPNLGQRITVSPDNTGPVTATTTLGGCPSTAPLTWIDTTGGQTFDVCVTISATGTGTVQLGFLGQQRRGTGNDATLAGWKVSHPQSFQVNVAPPAAVPAAPVITCAEVRNGNKWDITWTPVSGLTYTVHQLTEPGTAYASLAQTAPGSFSVVMGTNNSAKRVKMTATNTAGTSAFSNVLRVTQGNGAANMACGASS